MRGGLRIAASCAVSTVLACHVAPKSDGPPPDPRGCIAAVISHEEHTEAADGVAHDVSYRERFFRCGDHVWTERVLSPRHAQEHEARHGHRELPPMHRLGKLLTRGPDGQTALALVSREERQVIAMSPPSFDLADFHGDFAGAAHLVAPSALAQMTDARVPGAPAGSRWLEKRGAAGFVRVLWSTAYDFPLEIESGTADGSKRDHITVKLETTPERFPWDQLDGYAKASDSDFMD